jgi:hypothetical protein
MENSKRVPGMRGLVALAYANGSNPKWKRPQEQSVPGPLFDAFVIGIFLVLAIGYFVLPI